MRFMPSRSDRSVFGKIAEEYDLVYFGNVSPKVDQDYEVVGGLTLGPDARDENYTTGNVYDYEIAFLQRSRNVKLLDGRKTTRKWTILQIKLNSDWAPHFLVDGRSRASDYGALLASTQRWSELGARYLNAEQNYFQTFATFARLDGITEVEKVLHAEVQTMLATYFAQFDFEFNESHLLIYATEQTATLQSLDHMLRVGLWLARFIDAQAQTK